jgi:hypothetical protein
MAEQENNTIVSRKFAIFVNGKLVSINNCDDRMAAILGSTPKFEEIIND